MTRKELRSQKEKLFKEEIKLEKQHEYLKYEKENKLLLMKACKVMESDLAQKEQNMIQQQAKQDKLEQKLLKDLTTQEVKELRYLQKKSEQDEKELKLYLKEASLVEREKKCQEADHIVNKLESTHNVSKQTGARPKCQESENSSLQSQGRVLITVIQSRVGHHHQVIMSRPFNKTIQ